MAARYTPQQQFLIAAWYENFKPSVVIVQRKFRREFGVHAQFPSQKTIKRIHKKAIENGLSNVSQVGRPRHSCIEENVEAVKEAFSRSPRKSIRRASVELNLSRSTIHRILQGEKLHPYVLRFLHEISEEDCADRLDFCEEMLQLIDNDQEVVNHLLFTDEANFHLSGEVNRHNCRYWASDNPNFFATVPLHSPKVVVWMGVWSGGLLGPFFHEGTVNGDDYLDMLRDWLLPQLKEIEDFQNGCLIFQQDGAPPHWKRDVREWLDENFPGSWVGRGGPIHWPARSPDLTACDYWLWGDLKRRVYATRSVDVDELKGRIIEEAENISAETRLKALMDFPRRLRDCRDNAGGHIE